MKEPMSMYEKYFKISKFKLKKKLSEEGS